jgi:hypothetical protein
MPCESPARTTTIGRPPSDRPSRSVREAIIAGSRVALSWGDGGCCGRAVSAPCGAPADPHPATRTTRARRKRVPVRRAVFTPGVDTGSAESTDVRDASGGSRGILTGRSPWLVSKPQCPGVLPDRLRGWGTNILSAKLPRFRASLRPSHRKPGTVVRAPRATRWGNRRRAQHAWSHAAAETRRQRIACQRSHAGGRGRVFTSRGGSRR